MTRPRILDIECRGSAAQRHRRRDLVRLTWVPAELHEDGTAIYDPAGRPLDDGQWALYQSATRLFFVPADHGRRYAWQADERLPSERMKAAPAFQVEIRRRSDDGKTYVLPPCPTCRRVPELRDDLLSWYVVTHRDQGRIPPFDAGAMLR